MTLYRVGNVDADAEAHVVFLLERIALALEALVDEMQDYRQREQAARISTYRRIKSDLERAAKRFSAAERDLDAVPMSRKPSEAMLQRSRDAEGDMYALQHELDAYVAEYPGIAEMAGDA